MNYLSFMSMFCLLSSGKIIHYQDEYLNEAPVIDLRLSGSETILYVRLCEWSTMDGTFTILNMTRYCYCRKSCRFDPDNNSCSVPGPTLLMHDNTIINVTIVNELFGVPAADEIFDNDYNNMFRDIDITNLHVHGLHVSPEVDDVLVKINPNGHSWYYPYDIDYHYPGTFWYHAHHHVKCIIITFKQDIRYTYCTNAQYTCLYIPRIVTTRIYIYRDQPHGK